jgi:GT2 family glycosyltransferase
MQLSTVICNYNTRDKLARLLDSLLAIPGDLEHEIIVVDNASPDDSAAMVRERFPSVTLIASPENRWFSGGNNLGLRAARGDFALILNPDTVIPPDALQTLLAYLDAHPQVGAVTCRMVFADGRVQMNGSRLADYTDFLLSYTFLGALLPRWRDRRRAQMWYAGWDRGSTQPVEVAPGSFILARRALLDRIDYFDERLKLFFTDDDLCRKLLATGAAIHYVADVTILHDEHASLEQVPRLTRRVYFEDLLAYSRKYHGALAAGLLAILLVPTRLVMQIKERRV